MPKIFFCYRRDDSAHQAGRVYDRLEPEFGADELFKDTDSIQAGEDFRTVLTSKVDRCDMLLAFIGDNWLTSADENGGRKLDSASDFVRIEIEEALRRNIPVVPLLVGRVKMPQPGDLPESLRDLAFRQALEIRTDPDFRRDVARLIQHVRNLAVRSAGAPPAILADLAAHSPPDSFATASSMSAAPGEPRAHDSASGPSQADVPKLKGSHTEKYLRDNLLRKKPDGREFGIFDTGTRLTANIPRESAIRLGILKSGNATYCNEIERELLRNLNARLSGQQVRVLPSTDCVDWEDQGQWEETVNRLQTRGGEKGFHYLVGIGTQAAVALHNSLGRASGKTPTLLLGVTYPRTNGLVDSEQFRCETRQVACIRYGCGLDAVASLLHHRIFPNRKLCFVYQAGIPQDEMAYIELTTTRLKREGLLRFLRLEKPLQAGDLADKETVYFSWYTFTRLFHEKEFSILRDRLSVSIMQDNVRDGVVMAGVGTDHDWIGRRGSEMIIEHFTSPAGAKPDWGSREVLRSPLIYWLNRCVAKRCGISFPKAALDKAAEVYD